MEARWIAQREPAGVGKLRCLVALCLVGVLVLTLPVLYLLNRSARQISQGEMPAGKTPEPEKLQADAPNSSSCISEIKPRTHLTPQNQPNLDCVSGAFPILHWRNDRPGEKDAITYSDGYLTVPDAGDYFVYAQVTFRCPDSKCDMKYCGKNLSDESQITQIISKISISYGSEPIPQLTASTSIEGKEKWKKTLYLGGVIRLRKEDKLMVNVSNPMLVDSSSPALSFFGAFLI